MSVDWTKPIQTRNGKKAEYVGRYNFAGGESVIVVVDSYQAVSYFEDGGVNNYKTDDYDIINVPIKKHSIELDAWAVLNLNGRSINVIFNNEDNARIYAGTGFTVRRITGTCELHE